MSATDILMHIYLAELIALSSAPASPSSYLGPREVLSGPGASAAVSELLKKWGIAQGPILVVRDTAVAGLNLGAAMIDALAAAGFTPVLFDDVKTEPTREIAHAVLERARESHAIAVIGMGGGSSMDLAKIGATYAHGSETIDAIIDGVSKASDVLPLVLIPTTAGTGAEATRVSMISVNDHKRIVLSHHFVPLVAVLDPVLIASLPPSVTASGGLDALSHAFEAFISTNATPLTESASRSAIRTLATALQRAYDDGKDAAARAETLTAAHLAGWSLNAGVVVGHSIAYTIANRTHLPHGITTGMSLPYALAYSLPKVEGRLLEVAESLPGLPSASVSVTGLLTWIRDLGDHLGAPTSLDKAGIPADQTAAMAQEVVRDYPRPNNPVPLEEHRLTTLLEHFHQGDLVGAISSMNR